MNKIPANKAVFNERQAFYLEQIKDPANHAAIAFDLAYFHALTTKPDAPNTESGVATPNPAAEAFIAVSDDVVSVLSPGFAEGFRSEPVAPEQVKSDQELRDWETSEHIGDDLHHHFSAWGRWDWCDISDEAARVYGLMFDVKIENDSPVDAIFSAAVAHANNMAYEAVAASLGVKAEDLRITVSVWSENQDKLPPPVTATRLMELVEETRLEYLRPAIEAEATPQHTP